jgi:hypothetical protein
MVFLVTIDAPVHNLIRVFAPEHMVFMHWCNLPTLGASAFSRSTLTAKTIPTGEPPAPESERGRVYLAAFAAKDGDGGEQHSSLRHILGVALIDLFACRHVHLRLGAI